jgi:hypothetical protein
MPQAAVCFMKLVENMCHVRELQSKISPRNFVSLVHSVGALKYLTSWMSLCQSCSGSKIKVRLNLCVLVMILHFCNQSSNRPIALLNTVIYAI